MKGKWKKIFYKEIAIEYKTSIYTLCISFFYYFFQILNNSFQASILHLIEITLVCYFMCYIQVHLLHGFDEKEKWGKQEVFKALICAILYMICSYILDWYNRDFISSIFFGMYVLLCFVCISFINRFKRNIDTKKLNMLLNEYKRQGANNYEEDK